MTTEERPEPGAVRFTGTGDVEVFDGTAWRPVESVISDSGIREDPPRPPAEAARPAQTPGGEDVAAAG